MGTLIPNPMDQQIIAKLNVLFDHHFAKLKGHNDHHSKLLDPANASKLHRIARRIGAYPDSKDYQNRNPRARWYVFLRDLPPATQSAILTVINAALGDAKAQNIVFNVAYEAPPAGAPPTVYVYPANTGPVVFVSDAAGAKNIYLLTLVVQEERMNVPDKPSIGAGKDSANEAAIPGLPWPADDDDY